MKHLQDSQADVMSGDTSFGLACLRRRSSARGRWKQAGALVTAMLLSAGFSVAVHGKTPAEIADQPATMPAVNLSSMPFVRVNHKHRWVDVDATVNIRQGGDITTLLGASGLRDHASLLVSKARPLHLHMALLSLETTPGTPMVWSRQDQQVVASAARGPGVKVSIRYLYNQEKMVEIDAGQWVMDSHTGQPMKEASWVFAGSKFLSLENGPVYLADVRGTMIALINTPEDVVSIAHAGATVKSSLPTFRAHSELMPQEGASVVVRLILLDPPAPTANPQESGESRIQDLPSAADAAQETPTSQPSQE